MGRLIRAEEYDSSTGASILKVENKFDSLGRPVSTSYVTENSTQSYSIAYKEGSSLISRFSVTDTALAEQNISIVFIYDAMDRVISRTTVAYGALITESFTYTQSNGKTGSRIASHNMDGTVYSYSYDGEGNISSISKNGQWFVSYEYDKLGQLIFVEYADENIGVYEYVYDPYGNVVSITGSKASTIGIINPFLYRGYYYDYDLGWYYLNSRYYDPVVGRFINADSFVSTGQGILGNNMFAYCGNNPVVRVDENGELWISTFIAATILTSIMVAHRQSS